MVLRDSNNVMCLLHVDLSTYVPVNTTVFYIHEMFLLRNLCLLDLLSLQIQSNMRLLGELAYAEDTREEQEEVQDAAATLHKTDVHTPSLSIVVICCVCRYKVREEKARLLREQAHTEEARKLQEEELKKMSEARDAAAAERKKAMEEMNSRQEELDKQRQAAQAEHQKQLQGLC